MIRYLVTGGAGFIGANYVKHLVATRGNEVEITILDNLTYAGNLLTIKEELKRDNVTFVRGDIGDAPLVRRLLAESGADRVVNFAAESHVDRSISNPRLFLETNILGTQTLLEECRKAWAVDGGYLPGKRFLQISTDEVYGSLTKDFEEPQPLKLDEDVARVAAGRDDLIAYGRRFFTEETPLAPRSPYSASKTSADLMTLAYRETYGLPVNITRCSNNYGPYQFPEKLIPLIIKNVLEGRRLPVYGRGLNVRDWLYVGDHCRAIEAVLDRGRVGEIYNIGGFNEESNIRIVGTILEVMRRLLREPRYAALSAIPADNVDASLIDYVADRPGHDMRYAIDPSKIARELGWVPETPFSRGIEETVRWNLDNRDWIDSVTSGDYQRYYEEMYGNRK